MILKSAASSVEAPDAQSQQNASAKSVTTLAATAAAAATVREFADRVPRRVPIIELNEHLTCFLCKGYFVDATTIIECLHSFCRSCLVKYLVSNKYCPVCDVQVHKTKPLLNIRPDKTLQDVVYKLVPKLYQNEMQKRCEYYTQHPESSPSPLETRGETSYQYLLSPDEMLCISLAYNGASDKCTLRYLRCSASVSISHLQKLIRNKYDLSVHHKVEVLHQEHTLSSYLTLIDIAYIHLWRRKGPLELTYRIYESINKISRGFPTNQETNNNDSGGEEGWKEVQLRISENGEMSFTGIQDCLSLLDENILKDDEDSLELKESKDSKDCKESQDGKEVICSKEKKQKDSKEIPKDNLTSIKASPSKKLKLDKRARDTKLSSLKEPKRETRSALQALQAKNTTDEKTSEKNGKTEKIDKKSKDTSGKITKDRKRKSDDSDKLGKDKDTDIEVKKSKKLDEIQSTLPAGISITLPPTKPPLQNLSNNHPLKKHSLSASVKSQLGHLTSLNCSTTVTASTYQPPTVNQKPSPPCELKTHSIPVSATSSAVKATSASSTYTTSASATSIGNTSESHSVQTGQSPVHYAQYPRVYTPPSTNYTPINVPTFGHPGRGGGVQRYPHQSPVHPSQSRYIPPGLQHQQQLDKQKFRMDTPKGWKPPVMLRQVQRPQTPPLQPSQPPGPVQPGSTNDLRNVRPAKFFKMRNNMPRYLGCPASGVKPMYTVQGSPEKEDEKDNKEKADRKGKPVKDLSKTFKDESKDTSKDSQDVKDTTDSKEDTTDSKPQSHLKEEKKPDVMKSPETIKRHSIVKIDPKTLKPIAERAPDLTSLTTTFTPSQNPSAEVSLQQQRPQELKINTSSVSIFNPIKLQSERKSPHSPISKRPASTSSPTITGMTSNTSTISSSTSTMSGGSPGISGVTGVPPLAMSSTMSGMPGMIPMSVHSPLAQPHQSKQKANLSYTPPNPFVPHLQAPTMGPNQFMYTSPGGYPYDPIMAAFLAYSRAPFNYDFHKLQMGQMGQIGNMQIPYGVQPLVMMSQQSSPPAVGKKAKEVKEVKDKSKGCSSSPKVEKVESLKISQSATGHSTAKDAKQEQNTKEVTQVAKTSNNPVNSSTAGTSNTTPHATALTQKDPKEVKTKEKEVTRPKSVTPPNCKSVKSEKSLQNALDKLTKAKMNVELIDDKDKEKGNSLSSQTNSSDVQLSLTSPNITSPPPKVNKIEIKSQITITPQGVCSISSGAALEETKNKELKEVKFESKGPEELTQLVKEEDGNQKLLAEDEALQDKGEIKVAERVLKDKEVICNYVKEEPKEEKETTSVKCEVNHKQVESGTDVPPIECKKANEVSITCKSANQVDTDKNASKDTITIPKENKVNSLKTTSSDDTHKEESTTVPHTPLPEKVHEETQDARVEEVDEEPQSTTVSSLTSSLPSVETTPKPSTKEESDCAAPASKASENIAKNDKAKCTLN